METVLRLSIAYLICVLLNMIATAIYCYAKDKNPRKYIFAWQQFVPLVLFVAIVADRISYVVQNLTFADTWRFTCKIFAIIIMVIFGSGICWMILLLIGSFVMLFTGHHDLFEAFTYMVVSLVGLFGCGMYLYSVSHAENEDWFVKFILRSTSDYDEDDEE